jgi:hypothetical protein
LCCAVRIYVLTAHGYGLARALILRWLDMQAISLRWMCTELFSKQHEH